jgi:antirestriction protein ArdC
LGGKIEMSSAVYRLISKRIIDSLDKGIVPWRKPWSMSPGMRPHSVAGRAYNGINEILLGLSPYSDPRWLTYKKALELGGMVRKGEKSSMVIFWKIIQKKGSEDTFPILKYFNVFNVAQCDDLDIPELEKPEQFNPVDSAESIIDNMPSKPTMLHNGGDRAYYRPSTDEIHLPLKTDFHTVNEYYSTAFHELGHSTGHGSRLNRHGLETGIAAFGSPVYSREELAAEFTSAFLCHMSGIENTIANSTAYIGGWLKALKNDPQLAIKAATQGQKAADYILGK